MGAESESDFDYRAIVESVPAIVFVSEPGVDGAWLFVNEWIEPILGFTVEEWTGDPSCWQRQLHPEDRDQVIAAEAEEFELVAASGTSKRWGTYYLDYRMIHKDGHVVWVRDSSALIPTADGGWLWHGVLMDVTDQKQVEAQLERQSAAQAAVARLGEHALSGAPIEELLNEACQTAAEVLDIDAAVTSQLGEDRDSLTLRAEYGWNTDEHLRHRSGLDPRAASTHTLATGKPVLVQDWNAEDRFATTEPLTAHGVRSSLGVRIEGPARPWGLFGAFSAEPNAFTESDVNFVVSLANILADAIERQDAEDAMQHRALHDPLTGLPNRVLFADRLEQALERSRRHAGLAAVLFVDVDHFKQVNDTLGHQAGDDLLIAIASRLREAVRPADTVARFGGDEFGLLLEEITSERVAIATAERIAAGFARPFMLDAGSQFVTASIGIALADGHHDAQTLLRDADASMYRAKQRGRARYDLFDDDLRVRALARGRTENELRRAVEFRELRLVYQPVVDLRDERINAVEALLRWDHPQRGTVPPSEFIPVAEESGMIDRIGQWVIEEALRDAARWEQLCPDQVPILVGINVSVQQLQNPRFPETVSEAIAAAGVEPQNVALELDESVLRDEAEQIRSALRLLKRIGVRLAVHDFGTGDSSLRQLAALPIDTIKVDRRFVAALGTEDATSQIAQAVIATGSALELRVIGAGAETADQVQELRRLGCSSAQGFLFSKPLRPNEIASLLAHGRSLRRTLT